MATVYPVADVASSGTSRPDGVENSSRATATCEACVLASGDLTTDVRVDGDDTVALAAILAAPDPIRGCLAWAADIIGDGSPDGDDTTALEILITDGESRCAP